MADWNSIFQGIDMLGRTKSRGYEAKSGALSEAIGSKKDLWSKLNKFSANIDLATPRRDKKQQEFQDEQRIAGEEFIDEQAKKAKGYFDESGVYHPGTDVGGSIAGMKAKTVEELKLMFPTVDEETLERFVEQLKMIGAAKGDVEAQTAGKVQTETFMTPWEEEGYPNFEAWRQDQLLGTESLWVQYGFADTDEGKQEWRDWQEHMASMGRNIDVSDDADNFSVKAHTLLTYFQGEHEGYFQDEMGRYIPFLDISSDQVAYLKERWGDYVKNDDEASELTNWFDGLFRSPATTIDPGAERAYPTDIRVPFTNLDTAIDETMALIGVEPITGQTTSYDVGAIPLASSIPDDEVTTAETPYVEALSTLAETARQLRNVSAAEEITSALHDLDDPGEYVDLPGMLEILNNISALLGVENPYNPYAPGRQPTVVPGGVETPVGY